LIYDDSVPDVIKKSIIQASMSDPVRMVQAPENFKEQHYTEHTSHTQMHPRAAMSLASALQNEISKGGRGAEIFQKRKARSEKWVVADKSGNGNGQQMQQPSPQTPQFQYPAQNNFIANVPVARDIEPPKQMSESFYKLSQESSNLNENKYSDFNTTPRGWGSSGNFGKF
jgi:hypothetical protein